MDTLATINFLKGRGFTTEKQVRDYLKTRIPKSDVVDALVIKMAEMKIIALADINSMSKGAEDRYNNTDSYPEPPPDTDELGNPIGGKHDDVVLTNPYTVADAIAEKSDNQYMDEDMVLVPAYKKAMAVFFQNNPPMPRIKMKMAMAFKMDWFKPTDADLFISFCLRDKLIEEKDGLIQPTFDANSVEILADWSLHEELGIKDGREIAQEKIRNRERERDIAFVQTEKRGEVQSLNAEDGIEDAPAEIFDIHSDEDSHSVSDRNKFKASVARKLAGIGLPSKSATGLFDLYELNCDLLDVDMFVMNGIQFESVGDDKLLRKAFDILSSENWRGH